MRQPTALHLRRPGLSVSRDMYNLPSVGIRLPSGSHQTHSACSVIGQHCATHLHTLWKCVVNQWTLFFCQQWHKLTSFSIWQLLYMTIVILETRSSSETCILPTHNPPIFLFMYITHSFTDFISTPPNYNAGRSKDPSWLLYNNCHQA